MAQDITQKAVKIMVDALSDSRFNPTWFAIAVGEHADSNEHIQSKWWQTNVAYLYNRSLIYDLGLARTAEQDYACSRSSRIVHEILEPEYAPLRNQRKQLMNSNFPLADISNLEEYDR